MYYTVRVQKRLENQQDSADYLTYLDNICSKEIDHALTDPREIRTDPVEMAGTSAFTQPDIGNMLYRPLGMMKWNRRIFTAVNDQGWRKNSLQ
jgi:hypothetical protein